MSGFNNKTVAEIVAEDYRTAKIFETYKIDFCYNGNKKLDDVLKEKNLDPEKIITELTSAKKQNNNGTIDFKSLPLDLLLNISKKNIIVI